ncbi:MAG TPA: hypothetical protein VEG60_18795 [Candidatus Binatia bacterium]|nr:hypothetical protein [Candidatus Binatia bacterium]
MENFFFDNDEDLDAEDFLAADDIFPEDKRSLIDPPVCLSCGCSELEPCPRRLHLGDGKSAQQVCLT